MKRVCRPQEGFTLVEALISFVIAAAAISAIYSVFATQLRSSDLTERYRAASELGTVLLTEAGISLAGGVGPTSGVSGKGYRWRISKKNRGSPKSANSLGIGSQLIEVIVQVEWDDRTGLRRIELRSLRLGSR